MSGSGWKKRRRKALEMMTVVGHPLVMNNLTRLRMTTTGTAESRRLTGLISQHILIEATRDLPTTNSTIWTPMGKMKKARQLTKQPYLAGIARAGYGMQFPISEVIYDARMGFIDMYRDEETLRPVVQSCKAEKLKGRRLVLVDNMLATAHSAEAAIRWFIEKREAVDICFLCVVAAPEGVLHLMKLQKEFPHIKLHIFAAALDKRLNKKGYILPGLGDAGDGLFGTK